METTTLSRELPPSDNMPSPQSKVFHITGEYVGAKGADVMQGAMYVGHISPSSPTQKYPIVMFHGAGQTSANWLTTPDGREGWAHYFVKHGYQVYITDQPARG